MATENKKQKLSGVANMVKNLLTRKPKDAKPVSQIANRIEKTPAKKEKPTKPVAEKKVTVKASVAKKLGNKIEIDTSASKAKRKEASKPIRSPEVKRAAEKDIPKQTVKEIAKKSSAKSNGVKNGNGKGNGNGKERISIMKKNIGDGPKYFFKTDIPDSYNETYLRAIPRDPQWMFVFWELSEQCRNDLRVKMGAEGYGTAKRVLRLIDVTDNSYDGSNPQRYTDIEINEFANNWYVQVPESNHTYLLEIGLLTKDGRFYFAARSNIVGIPRKGVSQFMDEEWDTVATDELIRMSSEAMQTPLGASERRFAAAETFVGHAGLVEEHQLANSSGSGGFSDFSSSSRY